MDICLINPRSQFLIDEAVMPPLGLWGLVSALSAAGYKAEVVDLGLGDTVPEAPIYGVSGTSAQIYEMERLVPLLRSLNHRAWLIAGGPHATLFPFEMFRLGYDTVVRGEAEHSLAQVLQEGREQWDDCATTPKRITDLDSLPFPDRSQAHRYQYEISGKKATTAMSSRGCVFSCSFCAKQGASGRQWIGRSAANVVAEAQRIRDLGFGGIMYYDDTIAQQPARLFDICDGLSRLDLRWRCFLRASQIMNRVAQALAQSGCVEVGIGVESGSNRILKNINKAERVDDIRRGIDNARKAGLRVKTFFILGLPGETEESIEETERFIAEVQPDNIDFTVLSVLGGTPIYDRPERYDVLFGSPGNYKGKPGEYTTSTRTKTLSRTALLEHRQRLEEKYKKW